MTDAKFEPTRIFNGYGIRPGDHVRFGAGPVPGGVNFTVASIDAESVWLLLFHRGDDLPFVKIPFFDDFRCGNVYSMMVFGVDFDEIEYAFAFDGPSDKDVLSRFDKDKILLDPYGKSVAGREEWGICAGRQMRSVPVRDQFDWDGDRPLERDMRDLVIYEAHVRGLTRHPSSGVAHPGTYAGVIEKIPYFKELGINCIEFMPIFEFDETENSILAPDGSRLLNYWGYSTVAFFAPKAGYSSAKGRNAHIYEFKTMVRELHKSGIEVILDVVFNHTAEMGEGGPYISFRGIDDRTYYMLTPDGEYLNFSGCGNTMNCNHPIVRNMIVDCLRYWVSKFHIDGFRFDLASILGRDTNGVPMTNPPLIESLALDPVLGRTKLIAEAWDAGGLYQVGSFPSWGRWAEWNGRYRDDVRRFLKADPGMTEAAANYLNGSRHMYAPEYRGSCASINFITCHDGFTLMDLFSYASKNNLANGEDDRDGTTDNHSWDCVLPGDDPVSRRALRHRMVKNALTFLMLSHSVPMMLAGDEFGNSQQGNNNAYCQDNEISWLDWTDLERNRDIFDLARRMIALRNECDCLKSPRISKRGDEPEEVSVTFHGLLPNGPDLSPWSTTLAVMFEGRSDCVYAAMNMHWEEHSFDPPAPPDGKRWKVWEDTFKDDARGRTIAGKMPVGPRSIVVLRAVF